MSRRQGVHAKPLGKVLLEAAGLVPGPNVFEGERLAAADRAAKRVGVESAEWCPGLDGEFFDALIGVVDEAASAAFESVRVRVVSGLRTWHLLNL